MVASRVHFITIITIITIGYRIIPDTGHIVGLLNPLYSLISERRQARNALLLALVKVLDPDLAGSEVEVTACHSKLGIFATADFNSTVVPFTLYLS
jgi:hypothetical protein